MLNNINIRSANPDDAHVIATIHFYEAIGFETLNEIKTDEVGAAAAGIKPSAGHSTISLRKIRYQKK